MKSFYWFFFQASYFILQLYDFCLVLFYLCWNFYFFHALLSWLSKHLYNLYFEFSVVYITCPCFHRVNFWRFALFFCSEHIPISSVSLTLCVVLYALDKTAISPSDDSLALCKGWTLPISLATLLFASQTLSFFKLLSLFLVAPRRFRCAMTSWQPKDIRNVHTLNHASWITTNCPFSSSMQTKWKPNHQAEDRKVRMLDK